VIDVQIRVQCRFSQESEVCMGKKGLIILAQGHEEVETITCIDLLRRAGITVTVAGLGSKTITGSHGITIIADCTFDESAAGFDSLILPGGMPGTTNLFESKKVLTVVKSSFERGLLCAAICAAPQVLDKAGILSGRKYTCFPGVERKISQGTFTDQPVVCDRNIITGKGVGTAIPFALAIVEYLLTPGDAATLADTIIYGK
jgi:4-methyl-5(b-hydroxyethyl)-thiazole monophosphate biosynthesis